MYLHKQKNQHHNQLFFPVFVSLLIAALPLVLSNFKNLRLPVEQNGITVRVVGTPTKQEDIAISRDNIAAETGNLIGEAKAIIKVAQYGFQGDGGCGSTQRVIMPNLRNSGYLGHGWE